MASMSRPSVATRMGSVAPADNSPTRVGMPRVIRKSRASAASVVFKPSSFRTGGGRKFFLLS